MGGEDCRPCFTSPPEDRRSALCSVDCGDLPNRRAGCFVKGNDRQKGPVVTDAAPCTFLHERREAALRCGLHGGQLCGQNRLSLMQRMLTQQLLALAAGFCRDVS